MAKSNATKKEWRRDGLSLFEAVVGEIIRNKKVKRILRVEIVPEQPIDEIGVGGCWVSTWSEEQHYQFYKKENDSSSDMTVIYVYQKHMSRENSGNAIQIEDSKPISDLENYDQGRDICFGVVHFLVKNMVWK